MQLRKNIANNLAILMLASLVTACSGSNNYNSPRVMKLTPTSFKNLSQWNEDNHSQAFEAYANSCDRLLGNDPEHPFSKLTSIGGESIDWQVPCMEAQRQTKISDSDAKAFFEKWFNPYKVSDEYDNHHGTLTGYFEIELEGSRKKHGKYKYPIYASPKNLDYLKKNKDLHHAAINDGILAGRNLEIAWVDNRARLYFMHIQGSGVIKLKEGGEIRVGYDGHNGYSFQGINDALKSENFKLSSSNETVVDWLHRNPERCFRVIETDPSYVFFKEKTGQNAYGGHGVALKTERSMAVDSKLYPYGTPIWIEAKLPKSKAYRSGLYSRLMIAQDAGGAIKGPSRGDVFFGRGSKAEQVAHRFKAKGIFYALFPKTIDVPSSYSSGN